MSVVNLDWPYRLTEEQINEAKAFEDDDNYEPNCCICFESDDKQYVNHENASHKGWHVECGERWKKANNTCPGAHCQTIIRESIFTKLMQGFSVGVEHAFKPHIFATLTATSIAALLCGQTGISRDVLAILGAGCAGAALLIGAPRRLMKLEKADSNGFKYAQSAGMIAAAITTVFALKGLPQFAVYPLQAIGALTILYKAGKMTIAKGAILGTMFGIGSIAAKANGILGKTTFTAAQTGGAVGGLAEIRKAPYLASLFSMAAGSAIAKATLQLAQGFNPYVRAILGAAAGGIAASSIAAVLDEGYNSYQQEGFTFF